MPTRVKASFLSPMLQQSDDPALRRCALKLDGYRTVALKTGGEVHLRSRNSKAFDARYAAVVQALAKLSCPVGTSPRPGARTSL